MSTGAFGVAPPAGLMALFLAAAAAGVFAQQPPARGGGAAQPPSGQAAAPVDLTGYWVSVVTEDWRWRMVTPPKGDYASVPISPAGRTVADQWDPSQDGSCQAYGAAGLMRMPGRFHITWQDGNTLKIESDAGQQTRLLHFGAGAPPGGARTLQGFSVAEWEAAPGGGRGRGGAPAAAGPRWAPLRVVTTHMTPGWLRRNGVPYSENAQMTETFIRFSDGQDEWLTISTRIDDPQYLTQPFLTSTNFKREPDGSKFTPAPCRS